jgi:hypothetical protein
MNLQILAIQLPIVELITLFVELNETQQRILLQHMQDEYCAISDEYSNVIELIIQTLYEYHENFFSSSCDFPCKIEDVQQYLESALNDVIEQHQDTESLEKFQTVLENMVELCKEEAEYLISFMEHSGELSSSTSLNENEEEDSMDLN